MRCAPLLLITLIASAAESQRSIQVAGYRRDGTGIYPDCAPPTAFSQANVVWTERVGWGHGSPIVVGDRVFIQVDVLEGVNDHPILKCLSTKDGSLLWERELDHGDLVGDGGVARSSWHEVMQEHAKRVRVMREYKASDVKPEGDSRSLRHPVLEAAGYLYDGRWKRLQPIDPAVGKRISDLVKTAAKGGYTLETWRQNLGDSTSHECIGHGYATPCSDGQRIYTHTAFNATFCFDLEGKPVWKHFAPGSSLGGEGTARSPILHGELLISDNDSLVRAYDRTSGRLLWKGTAGGQIVSPMVLTVGSTDVLLAAGTAYRLPDGKPLTIAGWKDFGMQTLVRHDQPDVVFFCGAGEHCGWSEKGGAKAEFQPPAAVRFALDGDTLRGNVLWHGKELKDNGGCAPWMLYHDGRFYHRGGAILNADTGKILAGSLDGNGNGAAVPRTHHLLATAGGHVYGMRDGKSKERNLMVMEVYTVDGRKVVSNELPAIDGATTKDWSYSRTFTFGGQAIYLRAMEHLINVH